MFLYLFAGFNVRFVRCRFSYDGPLLEEKALLKAADGGVSSREFVELCAWLSSRLKPLYELEEGITSGPGEPGLTLLTTAEKHFTNT